jgi:hypothetical protein
VKNKYVILRHLGDMCLFTSALRASVNKSHIPSLPQNNLYLFNGSLICNFSFCLGNIVPNVAVGNFSHLHAFNISARKTIFAGLQSTLDPRHKCITDNSTVKQTYQVV